MRFTLLKGITDPTNCHMPCLVTERKQQTPQTKIEHAERSKKDALSAHIQDPTVRNFPIIFLKFDIYHVAPLRIEISLFPAYINKYIYIYDMDIYIYVRQVSLVLFLCKLSHELCVALTLTYLPEFVLI